ncbi:MAG: GntR family transcriptional regulator [Chitinophagaceae bacterium]|nr:GntR family transcriptional regulator [Chitinophagaceae bacterium]
MKTSLFFKLIYFDEFSVTPKYQQLANCITKAIEDGKLTVGDVLPSINELSFHFEICRDTAEKGYKHLKTQGVIGSVPGKGYFISSVDVDRTARVFLMFNKLSPHKKIIYESKLIMLGKVIPGVTGDISAVYENFEKDIHGALVQALNKLKKYKTIKLIFPENSYYPDEIVKGFISFCKEFAFNYSIVHDIKREKLQKGEVYINLMDDDLVTLIEKIIVSKLKIGKEIGVISYNETPLKKIILNGITTISTDFEAMGIAAANIVKTGIKTTCEVPFRLTTRASL